MEPVNTLPQSRPLTRADLGSVPDDGHRYELVDGALIVTPAPSTRHQRAVVRLTVALAAGCPPGLEVMVAPFDVALSDDTVMQPDLLVARVEDFTEHDLRVPPVLAVEVLSPSTRLIDLNLKRARYEAAGCPAYWVIDPDQPSLTVWELRDQRYAEVANVRGEASFTASIPFQVTVKPSDLVR
jgi:Uma2 family endonuclease